MIQRQRDNLRRTFAARELHDDSPETLARVTRTQQELLEATTEFAVGASQYGDVQPLFDATAAMEQAIAALSAANLDAGTAAEEVALADLIRARQNLRNILKQSSDQSASQCRSFDKQQRQKLRTPEETKKEAEQQLAQTRDQLEQLAQQQRKWSEEIRQCSNPSANSSQSQSLSKPTESQSQSQSSSSSESNNASSSGKPQKSSDSQRPTAEQLAEQQQKALAAARELQEKLSQSRDSSKQADAQMQAAADAIEKSLDAVTKPDHQVAADQAQQAADSLEEISEQLAAMNAADFAERLGHAQRMAQRLAEQQQSLAGKAQGPQGNSTSGEKAEGNADRGQEKPSLDPKEFAGQQRKLAERTDGLAELLAAVRAEANGEDREVGRMIADLQAANGPAETAETMRAAADDAESGQSDRAAQSAAMAGRSLEELAAGLRQVRTQHSQPKLDELIETERQLAELMAALQKAKDAAEVAMSESKAADLQRRLEQIARGNPQLAEAAARMTEGGSPQATANQGHTAAKPGGGSTDVTQTGDLQQRPDAGWSRSQQTLTAGLRQASKELQAAIQKAILATALLDADQAVPPDYKDLVDEYYRVLSDDLR